MTFWGSALLLLNLRLRKHTTLRYIIILLVLIVALSFLITYWGLSFRCGHDQLKDLVWFKLKVDSCVNG